VSDVPAEVQLQLDKIGRGVSGQLQAEEVVGFYRTLRDGGLPRWLAAKVLLAWMNTAGEDYSLPEFEDDL